MRVTALIIGIASIGGLSACSDSQTLSNLGGSQNTPDEFLVLPTKPLNMPENLAVLPAPTPGGSNITDPSPQADAVSALGGNPAAVANNGIGVNDQGLVSYAARMGSDPAIRGVLAQEDAQWRSRHSRRLFERLAQTDVYNRAYRQMTLDPYVELDRWRAAGARTPSAPPEPEN